MVLSNPHQEQHHEEVPYPDRHPRSRSHRALAQSTADAGSSILDVLLTPGNIGIALGVVASGIGLFAGGSWLSTTRKRRIALAAFHAFHMVEDIAAEDPEENIVDKAARGLEIVDEWMRANGWRSLKPGEHALVRLEFKSLHGTQKAKEKALSVALGAVAAKAAVEATAVPTTPRAQ